MKKIIAIFISVVLCITCFAASAFADDLDTPAEPINIDEYAIREVNKTGELYLWGGAGNNGVTITVNILGDAELDSNGNLSSFSLTAFSHYETISGGALLSNSVSYGYTELNGNKVIAHINYHIVYQDANLVYHSATSSFTITATVQ